MRRPTAPPIDQPVSALPSMRLRGGPAFFLEVGRGVADLDRLGRSSRRARRATPRPRSAGSCRPRTGGARPGPSSGRLSCGRTSSRIAVSPGRSTRDLDLVDVVVRLVARGEDRAIVEDRHRRVLGRDDRGRGDRRPVGSSFKPDSHACCLASSLARRSPTGSRRSRARAADPEPAEGVLAPVVLIEPERQAAAPSAERLAVDPERGRVVLVESARRRRRPPSRSRDRRRSRRRRRNRSGRHRPRPRSA